MASTPLETFAARYSRDTLERIDRIAEELSRRAAGTPIKRGDALRVAVERGVEVLERELGIVGATQASPLTSKASKKGAKPARKPKP